MDPEERKMLERLLETSEQTNRVVRRMRREVLLVRFFHLFYWIIIIVVIYYAYYYIQPYLGNIDQVLQNLNKINLPH